MLGDDHILATTRDVDDEAGALSLRRALTVLGLVALLMLAVTAVPATGQPADRSTSPVFTMPPPAPPSTVGSSTVVRTDNGLSVRLRTSGLEPGHAATLWLAVANAPEECQAGTPLSQCGPADHEAGRGDISVHHAAGHIVGDDGTATYGAHLRVGDTSRALFEQDPGLLDPRGAEVLLIVKTHGPKIAGRVSEQLRTFNGGCEPVEVPPSLTPRPEVFGQPGPNDNCAEIQISVHGPAS